MALECPAQSGRRKRTSSLRRKPARRQSENHETKPSECVGQQDVGNWLVYTSSVDEMLPLE
eukprot:6183633-Pleurochrysis_carterae.AAC.1